MSTSNNTDLGRVFLAQQIATRLADAVVVKKSDDPAEAHKRLRGGDFDQAPVVDCGKCIGMVWAEKLRDIKKVTGALRWLRHCTIVSADAPLQDVLEPLCREGIVFLAGHRGIDSFATVSDLNRQAVRGHFYLLLSQVEMMLSDIVDVRVDQLTIQAAIKSGAQARFAEAREKGRDARPVEYLELEPLSNLFETAVDGDPRWGRELHNKLTDLCRFRPTVMHPTRALLGERQPEQLVTLAADADAVRDALMRITQDQ